MGRNDAFYQMIAQGINRTGNMNQYTPYAAFGTSLLEGYLRGKREKEEREWREREMSLRERESDYRMKRLDANQEKKKPVMDWLTGTAQSGVPHIAYEQLDTPGEKSAYLQNLLATAPSEYTPEERAGVNLDPVQKMLDYWLTRPKPEKSSRPLVDFDTAQYFDPDTMKGGPMEGVSPKPKEPEKPRWQPDIKWDAEGNPGIWDPNTQTYSPMPGGPKKAPAGGKGQMETGEEHLRRETEAYKQATQEYAEMLNKAQNGKGPAPPRRRIAWIQSRAQAIMARGDQTLREWGTKMLGPQETELPSAPAPSPAAPPAAAPPQAASPAGQYPPEVQKALERANKLIAMGEDEAEVKAALELKLLELKLAEYGYSSKGE